ncbi:MAG: hypothetical protein ACYC99_08530 [Candidatus Geothermincolia bacterium]
MSDEPSSRFGVIGKTEAVVFAAYAAVVAFMTWPAVTLVSRTYAQRGDPYGTIWWMWWFRFSFARHIPSNPMTWVGVPYGRNVSPFSRDPLTTNVLRGLSVTTTETVAYNIFLLLGFFTAAIGMYYLVRRLTGSRGAATVAGFIFGFSPYMLMQGKEHISLLTTAFIPLVFYFVIRAWKERSILMAALSAISFVIMTLFNYHYGLIGATLLIAFGLTVWLLGKPWTANGRQGALVRGVPVLLCVAGAVALVVFIYARRGSVSSDMTGLYLYSARPWDYFIPQAQGVALGWLTNGFITSHLHGGFLVENSLFVGLLPLCLAVYAFFAMRKRRGAPDTDIAGSGEGLIEDNPGTVVTSLERVSSDNRIQIAFAVSAVVCFLFSMPPTARLFGLKLYLPSYLLHYLVPDVRAYGRFGLGVIFAVAILAACGTAALLRKKEWSRYRAVIVTGLSLVVLIEFAIVPPFRSLDTASVTDYYEWLRERPGDPVVALYPFFYADDFQNYNYYFDQRHHEKKMVNGSEPGTEAEKIRQVALDLTNPDTPGILKKLGVRYVMAMPSLYRNGGHVNYIEPAAFDPRAVAAGLKPVKRFSDCVVYEDTAEPARIISLFVMGAYQAVVYPDGKAWHPGAREMMVNVMSELPGPVVADVTFRAAATSQQGTIQFELNGAGSPRRALTVWPSEFTIRSVRLMPGSNLLAIHADSKLSPVTEIPGSTEVRAAVMVSDIGVAVQR